MNGDPAGRPLTDAIANIMATVQFLQDPANFPDGASIYIFAKRNAEKKRSGPENTQNHSCKSMMSAQLADISDLFHGIGEQDVATAGCQHDHGYRTPGVHLPGQRCRQWPPRIGTVSG